MSAFELTNALIPELENIDFVCLNFANGDMVGHTGMMDAAIKACEAVDQCVESNYYCSSAQLHNYSHCRPWNCETMINPDGSPNTAHTTNPVPFILVDNDQIRFTMVF
jgi:2,3-bisphosphoglycerate-independent phosphoglycerate mutase